MKGKAESPMAQSFSFLSLALKNLRRKPLRTFMLACAITLLVSVMVFALSFIYRVQSGIRIMSDRLGADVLIVPAGARGTAEEVLLENKAKSFYMDKGVLAKVAGIKGVDQLTYQTYLVTLSGLCCDVPESIVIAFNQDTDFIIKPWLRKKLGRRLGKGEAIAGSESAFNINLGLMEVDSVLFGNVFRIVGVLDKTGTGLDNALFVSDENIDDMIRKGQSPVRSGQISIIFAKVKKGVDPKQVANAVEDTIIEADTVTRKDIGKSIINTLRDISRIFSVTVIIAAILSIFLTWTVFSAVAQERSREVGIMRSIGAKESHITRLFFTEVFLIGAVGSIAGIAAGTAFSFVLAKSFTILKTISTDLTTLERAAIAVASFFAGTGVCVIGALSPVRRIKKIEPLIVLKGD
jgi:putative ABC transport system permease protein